ncbi:GEVED domain-containing protein [Epilithonimonas arachidiradicis]|uniref:Putative secreted protein (Por secretion system target) n=1 Tax=Epilithonimonas arachidiradicis TaxID=1617282 RepID=A0A420DBQ2_9FLAO|nr:T9SS type A sorting domain-containing protein [Epilithonimonas arachidiradicis]RKE88919.1 putative secreted protein (Por secretion system target) [Epilithonimonas arachidiradicis]GGG54018.1 T9SS C-terminal target domain-containing protein [Epilithonimonas arachidiradicis]
MKKVYLLLLGAMTMSGINAQQIELKVLDGMGSRLYDINDNGKGIHSGAYFDFATGDTTPTEGGQATNRINNAGDVAGLMAYTSSEGEELGQAAYKKNGTWTAIGYFPGDVPSNSWFSSANAISGNSKYVTGQISTSVENSYAYIYDTEAGTIKKLDGDGSFEYGRGEGINSSGIVAGFVNKYSINGSTYWIPVYYTPDGVVHYIGDLGYGEAADINDAGQVVGVKDNKPFIYDINTNVYKEFNIPAGFDTATFTSISENGIAVGYAGYAGSREVIIYHPSLSSNPVFLKDILTSQNVAVTTFDGKLGTAMGISANGNYIAGFDNSIPPFFAAGWAINLNNLLLNDNDCSITCPENIETTLASASETSAVVTYTLSVTCGSSSSSGLQTVLVSGYESGSQFPIGVTNVVHNLVDADGKIVYVCSFQVTVNDVYCSTTPQYGVDSITKVQFAGIDNASDPYSSQANEYYLDKVGEVYQGSEYPIAIEANTNTGYDYATVFVDWNQNGIFTDAGEIYEVGAMTSDGMDGAQITGNIAVPANATVGKARMRVMLNWDASITTPCDNSIYGYGQAEDYTLDVKESLGVNDINSKSISYYPNPVKDILTLVSDKNVTNVSVYNIEGKLVRNFASLDESKVQLDLSTLITGTYVVKATTKDGKTKTFKVIKK